MRLEQSAGGVIVRRKNNVWEVLLITDKKKQLTFPKGLIETGEDRLVAARREISEEVGLADIQLLQALETIRYKYQKDGLINKTVNYFLFEYIGDGVPHGQESEGIGKVYWLPLEKAIERIGYPKTNKKLLVQASRLLKTIH